MNILAFVVLCAALLGGCKTSAAKAQPETPLGPGGLQAEAGLQPAAIVRVSNRTDTITVGQVQSVAERQFRIDSRIDLKLVATMASQDQTIVSTVDQQIWQVRSTLAAQLGHTPSDAEFNQALEINTGMNLSTYREQLLAQLYLGNKAQSRLKNVPEPSTAEIESTYQIMRPSLIRPQMVRFSLITVPFGASAPEKSRAAEIINRLSRTIHSDPSEFDEALLMAQAPNSGYTAQSADEIGYVPKNEQVRQTFGDAFVKTVFAMKQFQVSSVIEGPTAFYLVKVIGMLDEKFLEIDDPIQLNPPITTVRENIRNMLYQQRTQPLLDAVQQETVTELRADKTLYQECEAEVRSELKVSSDDWKSVLNEMIDELLLIQAAEQERITVGQGEVNAYLRQIRNVVASQLGHEPTDEEFAAAVKSNNGMTLPEFQEQLRRQMMIQRYVMSKYPSGMSVNPTEEQIQAAYESSRSTFVRPATIRYNAILTSSRDRANQLQAEIRTNPDTFDAVFWRAGSDYQVQENQYLPRVDQAQQAFGPAFVNAVFALEPRRVSGAIETPDGFAIVKVTEKFDVKFLELDDPVQLGNDLSVREYIRNSLSQDAAAFEKARVELVSELRKGGTNFRLYPERFPQ
ncbi:hypothetical protein FACS1894172_19060 [Spirochaetia bacterium]|nr:hypothetical protein FACS1894164_01490 [Spirochaetia bacterium]GHU36302.1 hypothetical protein FACS1894172_19060 [Spirochaetia bacterium]